MVFDDVTNLWARRGDRAVAGVCRPYRRGSVWSARTWDTDLEPRCDGRLYGRGAADMKSWIAAFVAAVEESLPPARSRAPSGCSLLPTRKAPR